MYIAAWLVVIAILYGLLLSWAAFMDETYFPDGSPGHRPEAKMISLGNGVFVFEDDYYQDRPA